MSAEYPSNNFVTKKRKISRIVGIIVLFLLIAAGIGWYIWSQNRNENPAEESQPDGLYLNPQSDLSFLSQQPSNPLGESVSGANNTNNPNQPNLGTPNTPALPVLKNYTNQRLGFSIDIPTDWVVEASGNDVVMITPLKARYSIQIYNVPNTDPSSFKSFLEAQRNLHNVTDAVIAGHTGYSFAMDGIYNHGYAFLHNAKVYYLLGVGIENSPIAQTFRIL